MRTDLKKQRLVWYSGATRTSAPTLAGSNHNTPLSGSGRVLATPHSIDTHACNTCGCTKTLSAFPLDNRRANGRAGRCRDCTNSAKVANRATRTATRDPWGDLVLRLANTGVELREVKNYPWYRVGSDGSLWGIRLSRGRRRVAPQRFKLTPKSNGYIHTILYGDGGARRHVAIHTVVLETFVGPCPDGMECRHLDGVPSNNNLSNLQWGTPLENAADRKRHGTHVYGERSPLAILTEQSVIAIRKRHWNDLETIASLASAYQVSESAICCVLYGVTWRHVK